MCYNGVNQRKDVVFMKRIGAIFLIFLCCTLLALPVFAESSASSVESAMSMIAGTARSMGVTVEE